MDFRRYPNTRRVHHLVRHKGFIVLLGILIGGLSIWTMFVDNKPLLANNIANIVQPRIVLHRKSESICNKPLPGQAACLAKLTLGSNGQPLTATPSTTGSYGPTQFHTAYQLPCTPGGQVQSSCATPTSFGPEMIAIVDAGGFASADGTVESALAGYDQYYNLPACTAANGCLTIVNQSGATSPLPADAGWSDEIALDVETAHMVCQTCKILLVEANDSSVTNLADANVTAQSFNPTVISNSWSSSVDETSLDGDFKHTGILEVASTGDSGSLSNGISWPADSPNVLGAAGTTLQINTNNTWSSEMVWSGSGGGCSSYYTAPSWQTSLSSWTQNGCGTYKSFGDVSADGDPNTGAAIYIGSSWYQVGGTSLSSPLIASMYALAGGAQSTNQTPQSIPYLQFNSTNSHDITTGNDCTTTGELHCTATTGFDTPSGLGSPNGITGFSSLPSPPVNLTVNDVDQNNISLSWQAPSATTGLTGYQIYRDDKLLTTTTGTTYTDSSLTPNTTYSYYVVAVYSSGPPSASSAAGAATTYYPEDINEDGHINLLDLSILASKYGQTGPSIGRADINHDGVVNLLDLSLLASKYGTE